MFADENAFFSPYSGGNEFLSSEPRKSLGGSGRLSFGGSEDLGNATDPFSQGQSASSQRGGSSGGGGEKAAQTPDGCVCATVAMLRRAVKARAAGGGPLQLNGRDVGLVALCGVASGLEIRPSLFKFTLEDSTSRIEVECSHKSAMASLQEPGAATSSQETPEEESLPPLEGFLSAALRGGLVTVYGFPCMDDKGDVYVDCFKINPVKDMREYVELFPLRIIAGALQDKAAASATPPTTPTIAPAVTKAEEAESKVTCCVFALPCLPPPAASDLHMYEHISDPMQRRVLKNLLSAKGRAVKRQALTASLSVDSPSEVEAALTALEESGEIAVTATWISLAS
ncbi:uncharacterized protein LOC34618906 [Cyclospora cayetanensis]|uniref:Uncharacterized protein LOC34618906 n=1 Tax=Cyclospora cayetanensis TaxID=88456 RepID=A0A6P6RQF0_9EIME|nr:uncharacterized protein LOC34618906 [Cyclospora cayetanensis]